MLAESNTNTECNTNSQPDGYTYTCPYDYT
jgi:hypothetical protein